MIALARQCFRFRELVGTLINRELRARYRGSILGSGWLILQPLMYLAVFYVVFNQFVKGALPPGTLEHRPGYFALAMFCGLVPWTAFVETMNRGVGCIVENGNLIKKFAFPSELLPAYLVCVSLFNTLVGFGLLAVAVFIFHGELPHFAWMFPIVLFLQGVFTLGFVYLLSSSAVYIRDIGHMMPAALNFWFFLTPIFLFAKFPAQDQLVPTIFRWNPVTYLIESYRSIFVYHGDVMEMLAALPPEQKRLVTIPAEAAGSAPWFSVGIFAAVAFAVLFVGYRVFLKLKPGFADEV